MTLTLPPVLAGLVPYIIAIISNILRSKRLPNWANGLIIGGSLVFIAGFATWLTHGFTSDLQESATIVLGFILLLLGRDAWGLLNHLEAMPSPLESKKSKLWQPTTQYPVANRANTTPTRPLDRQ